MNEWKRLAEKRGYRRREVPWPLERARMILDHEARVRALRVEARAQYASGVAVGRDRAIEELTMKFATDNHLVREIYRTAVEELARLTGEELARSIHATLRKHEPTFKIPPCPASPLRRA